MLPLSELRVTYHHITSNRATDLLTERDLKFNCSHKKHVMLCIIAPRLDGKVYDALFYLFFQLSRCKLFIHSSLVGPLRVIDNACRRLTAPCGAASFNDQPITPAHQSSSIASHHVIIINHTDTLDLPAPRRRKTLTGAHGPSSDLAVAAQSMRVQSFSLKGFETLPPPRLPTTDQHTPTTPRRDRAPKHDVIAEVPDQVTSGQVQWAENATYVSDEDTAVCVGCHISLSPLMSCAASPCARRA